MFSGYWWFCMVIYMTVGLHVSGNGISLVPETVEAQRNMQCNAKNYMTSADAFKSSSRLPSKVSRAHAAHAQHEMQCIAVLTSRVSWRSSHSSLHFPRKAKCHKHEGKKFQRLTHKQHIFKRLRVFDHHWHNDIMPSYSPDTSQRSSYQTNCSVLIRLGSAGILDSVEDSLLDWTHWPAEAECGVLELGFSFSYFYGRCKAMTESLEANLWYSQSVLSFIWWNSPARLWKCEHQLQKIQWQLLGGNISGSQHLDSMIQLESKHVKMIGNMSNIAIQQILVSCFFDLYVFMYYVKKDDLSSTTSSTFDYPSHKAMHQWINASSDRSVPLIVSPLGVRGSSELLGNKRWINESMFKPLQLWHQSNTINIYKSTTT